ncbi:hypothetical protein FQN54_003526 [Arachnomyces sp. PD_36]|nr:hypothetical protein FQN54_003526 [Arachnomyces sp. PD_36]
MSRCKDDAEDPPFEYNWINGVEALEKYRPKGYHPVMIGDLLHDRYRIVDKLGFGGYSTVWLARDMHKEEYVAVKVGVANSPSQEINCLRALSASSTHPGHDAIPSPLDEFVVRGPNGVHPCYTMIPARCNLREASFSYLFPLDVARALIGGLTMAIAHMHSSGYVHGDVHLRNILVKLPSSFNHLSIEQFYEKHGEPETTPITLRDGGPLPPNVPSKAVIPLYLGMDADDFKLHDAHVLLSDFGESYSLASETRHGENCHTPLAMRPPEARFEPQTSLSYSADIWSLAVAIWEILGMKPLFSNEYVTEDEMVSQHIDVLGPMPTSWWERWEERGEFFNHDGRPTEGREIWPELEQSFEQGVQSYRRKLEMGVFGEEETRAILTLVRQMLAFAPKERPTIEEVLNSAWMTKWVLPDLESCRNSK